MLRKLAGKDNAMKAKKVITLQPFRSMMKKAKALREIADEEEIILPKNSVCRKKTRGGSTQNNEVACPRLSASTANELEKSTSTGSDGRRLVVDHGSLLMPKVIMKYLAYVKAHLIEGEQTEELFISSCETPKSRTQR